MRILFVAHRLPWPPDKGDRIRSWRWLDALADRHDVWLGALAESRGEIGRAGEIAERLAGMGVFRRPRRGRAAMALATGRSLSEEVFRSRALLNWARRTAAEVRPDVLFCFSSTTAQYVAGIPGPRVMDLVDVDSAKWDLYGRSGILAPVWRMEARRLERVEAGILEDFDRVLTVSAEEAGELGGPSDRVVVVPNGVDTGRFRPGAASERRCGSIVFVGAMDYAPNVDAVQWFAKSVLPGIQRDVPEATFTIVGSNPARRVRRLELAPGVSVTGTVDDVRPYLLRASVSVAPLRIARGVQNKVLEAMAAGLPVVATPGALRGLDLEAGREVQAAAGAEAFARAVADLLRAPERAAAMGGAARAVVSERYDWKPFTRAVLELVEELGSKGQ